MPSMSTVAVDPNSPISSFLPDENVPSIQADPSSPPSVLANAQEGQSGGLVQTMMPNSSISAEQTAVSPEQTSQASPKATSYPLSKGNITQVSLLYQN